MFQKTTATKKIIQMDKPRKGEDGMILPPKRIRAVPGGTSASKTISILLFLIAKAQKDVVPTLTSVVSESVPHLKRGAIRDFLNILEAHGYFKEANWNKTDSIYTFENRSQIEFFSSDNGDKLRGARRDRLFINEANNVTFDAFEQLEVRTKDFIFLDWNPTNEFWFYTDVKNSRTDWEMITLTYKDNESLSPNIVDSIEQRQNRKGWWQVYGLGQLGEVEGKIYKDWQIIDEIPHEARKERTALDFGYSNDPTAIVDIYYFNGGYILDQVLFAKEMSNKQLADTLLSSEQVLCVADSAEPKSIAEIASYGVNIVPCEKGKDSVSNGIQLVQDQRISVTRNSTDIIREYRNYLWRTDKNGKILNVPESGFDHSMDAIRYGLTSIVKVGSPTKQESDRVDSARLDRYLSQMDAGVV
jgi:phage terminase large subunit